MGKSTQNKQSGHVDPPFRTADYPFYWIVHTANRYLQVLEPGLKAAGLDVPRWRALMVLYEKSPATVGELAARSITKLTTMTKIVQRMERDGLVTTRPRPSDNRATDVMLTAKGDIARRRAREVADGIYAASMNTVSARDERAINRVLAKIFTNFDTIDAAGRQAAAGVKRTPAPRRGA